jgi:hypothetical protein
MSWDMIQNVCRADQAYSGITDVTRTATRQPQAHRSAVISSPLARSPGGKGFCVVDMSLNGVHAGDSCGRAIMNNHATGLDVQASTDQAGTAVARANSRCSGRRPVPRNERGDLRAAMGVADTAGRPSVVPRSERRGHSRSWPGAGSTCERRCSAWTARLATIASPGARRAVNLLMSIGYWLFS